MQIITVDFKIYLVGSIIMMDYKAIVTVVFLGEVIGLVTEAEIQQ